MRCVENMGNRVRIVQRESVDVTHTAVLAECQPLAGGLQLLLAFVVGRAALQALGRLLVCVCHAAVALDVFLGVCVQLDAPCL